MSDSLPVVQKAHKHEWDDLKDMNTLLCSACGATIPCGKKKAEMLPVVQKAQPVLEHNIIRGSWVYTPFDIERERLGYEKKIEGYEKREQTLKKQIVKLAYRVSGLPMFHSSDLIEQDKIVKELLWLSKQ